MHLPNHAGAERIFARSFARELHDEEITRVSGGDGLTYCFDRHNYDDSNGDCQIP